jgi:V/A-type H+-transporting ATPase subunit K
MADAMAAISAALTMAGTGFATAWAEKVVGGATVGAMAEKPELFVRGLVLMVIPETIVLFGVLIAFLLIGKMG